MKEKNKLYNYCLVCGRKLKNIESRKRGYGSICARKINQNSLQNKLFNIK